MLPCWLRISSFVLRHSCFVIILTSDFHPASTSGFDVRRSALDVCLLCPPTSGCKMLDPGYSMLDEAFGVGRLLAKAFGVRRWMFASLPLNRSTSQRLNFFLSAFRADL